MCELFGVSAARKIKVDEWLREFFSHGVEHPHGWGMAFFYGNAVSLEKQPEATFKSVYLKQRLRAGIEVDKMIAHIRLATRGSMEYENTHPFVRRDNFGRSWTLAHNGTIFESEVLNPFVHNQHGQTDSERILYYLIQNIDELQEQKGEPLSQEERFQCVDRMICQISPENKLNLLLYDGEFMYVHTNYQDSLHRCKNGNAVLFSTRPLDRNGWENVPMNTLHVYQNEKLVFLGTNHGQEFHDSEEKMHLLFLDFANL